GERIVLLAGLAFGVAGFAIYGLAPTGSLFWIGVPLMALWGLSGPPVQGLMTRRVAPSEQGQLQGANGSLLGIAELVGPGIFTLTFATFISTNRSWPLPGAAFLLAAMMLLAAIALAWRVTQESQREPVAELDQATSPQ